jgi:hypothetical protein
MPFEKDSYSEIDMNCIASIGLGQNNLDFYT